MKYMKNLKNENRMSSIQIASLDFGKTYGMFTPLRNKFSFDKQIREQEILSLWSWNWTN